MIAIRRVSTPEELAAVARFRYAVYVEEMQRPQKDADHDARTIIDALDDFGHIYAAWKNGEVVGTVRSNYLRDGDIGSYFDYYALGDFLRTHKCEQVSITTRLMVEHSLRRTSLGVRLACATYKCGLASGIVEDFIDCNGHLVPLFTGLGYQLHRRDLVHPEYGPVTVMKLPLRDIAHLENVRSPFARIYRETREPILLIEVK